MESDSKRRQVSLEQLTALLEYLKEHQELAKGLTRGRRGKLHTLKLWNLCAKKLNVCKEGAVKDGKGWSKYWCDWKYRVRRRALELKAAQESNRPAPDGVTALSPMEETILSIIGGNSLNGVIIKSDPLGDEETFEEADNENHNDSLSFPHYSVPDTRPTRSKTRKRRHLSRDISDLVDVDCQDGCDTPDRKPRVNRRSAEDSDGDEAAQFLELERQKLDTSRSIRESLKTIASELTRLTDVISDVKDVLINRINV